MVVAHKILVSAPVPLELILTGFDWVGAGPWGFGTGLDNKTKIFTKLSIKLYSDLMVRIKEDEDDGL